MPPLMHIWLFRTMGWMRAAMLSFLIVMLALAGLSGHGRAHEYWLEPAQPIATADVPLRADARVGQFFRGESLPWLPDKVARLGVADAQGVRMLKPVIGDMPMFNTPVRRPGAQILFLETKPETLTWETQAKFVAFLEEKKLDHILRQHRARGLPAAGFREHYVRHAKALLWRGELAQARLTDKALGLKLELVALDDPLAVARSQGELRVQLLWQGKPLPGSDVQVFASNAPHDRRNEAHPRHLRTDAQGVARVSVRPGWHYMINAVHMLPLPEDSGAVWISHWASLSLAVPAAAENQGQ